MKLDEVSAAYAAYKMLDRLPKNAQRFTLLDNGWPHIHFGELRCRMPLAKGGLCGRGFARHQALGSHVSMVHRIPDGLRPRKSCRGPSHGEMDKLGEFYEEMMRGEDVEGILREGMSKGVSEDYDPKRLGSVQNSVAMSGTPSTLQQDNDREREIQNDENDSSVEQEALTQGPASGIILQPSKAASGNEVGPNLQDDHALDATAEEEANGDMSEAMVIDDDDNEEEVALQIEETEVQGKLYAAQLRKIQLKRKLAAMRKKRRAV